MSSQVPANRGLPPVAAATTVAPTGARVLRVDASMRNAGSKSRELTDRLITRLTEGGGIASVTTRDLVHGIEFVDEAWIGANFTPEEDRSDAQKARLAGSDALVEEVKAADILVIGAPIYNFSVPAAMKAWIDQIARARKTFKYTENGPVGLLEGKKAYVVVTSGGVPVGSAVDFASGYLRHVLGFIGIEDVTIIAADSLMQAGDAKVDEAAGAIDALFQKAA